MNNTNSAYGSLSMHATTFAGHKEYFSTAVTSGARIANLIAGQVNSRKVDEICGLEPKEKQFGMFSYLDNIPQEDTDSILSDSILQVNDEEISIEDFYNNTKGVTKYRGDDNFIKHIKDNTYTTPSINLETGNLEYKNIRYIMKHKVKKRMFKITSGNKSITVTEDHSCIIKRNNKYISVKPRNILKTDKIIKI